MITAFLFLSGCWSSHEVNALAICSAMGIDKAPGGYVVTEQIINPKSVASKNPNNQSPVTVYSTEAESIDGAVNYILLKASRLIYNTHLRLVVISEDVAKDGIKSILDYFMRSYEYRTDFFFLIAKGSSAKDILSTLTPLESIPGVEMFTMLKLSADEVGVTNDMKIIELTNAIISKGSDPALTGVEIISGVIRSDSTDTFKNSGGYSQLKFGGMAAFNEDKFSGWLNEEESKGYNYIKHKIKASIEVVKCPDDSEVICNILKEAVKIKAEVKDNKPVINIKITVKYAVSATKGTFDISKVENTPAVNKALEDKIKAHCDNSVKKALKEYKTDIFGFGEAVHKKNPGYWKTTKDKWNEEIVNLPVEISVKAEIVSIGEITKSLFAKEKD